jgi:hypothetical protein
MGTSGGGGFRRSLVAWALPFLGQNMKAGNSENPRIYRKYMKRYPGTLTGPAGYFLIEIRLEFLIPR